MTRFSRTRRAGALALCALTAWLFAPAAGPLKSYHYSFSSPLLAQDEAGADAPTDSQAPADGADAASNPGPEPSAQSGDTGTPATDTAAGSASDAQAEDTSEPEKPKVDPADAMYGEAHMKLARRHFKTGNVDRAKEELNLVIERLADHTEARFMRAVIAAKTKDFMGAWRHITVAEQSAPDHPRIKEFVARLEKAMPRPSVITEEVAARPAPTHASELLSDAIEAVFADKAASARLTGVGCTELAAVDGKTVAKLVFEGNAALEAGPVENALKSVLKGEILESTTASEGQTLKISAEVPGLPLLNPAAKPVPSIGELLKTASEETDVALKNSSESEPDADKRITGTYTIVAASLRTVNDFLRRISPQALDGRIVNIVSTTMNTKSVWKGDVSFRFTAP
ncbi:MAG TPA: hypothetical protein PLP29_01535 [Candidatus Ozemobacteraceae bacterium]|nr:hypothetical protein [Candidatus Ozemobacteraceae bacterium]